MIDESEFEDRLRKLKIRHSEDPSLLCLAQNELELVALWLIMTIPNLAFGHPNLTIRF
jgi:hypothetical protein